MTGISTVFVNGVRPIVVNSGRALIIHENYAGAIAWTFISEFRRVRQGNHKFKVNLTYIAKISQERNERK